MKQSSLDRAHERFERLAHYRHDDFCDRCKMRFFDADKVSVREGMDRVYMRHRDCKNPEGAAK